MHPLLVQAIASRRGDIMANHSVEAVTMGTMALYQAMLKHLQSKGLLTDREFAALVTDATSKADDNVNRAAINDFIYDAMGAPRL